jgi:hypothetical protein
MLFNLQHNNKKMHLLDDDYNPLCGRDNRFMNVTPEHILNIENGEIYERDDATELNQATDLKISDILIERLYCKKCIHKAKQLSLS